MMKRANILNRAIVLAMLQTMVLLSASAYDFVSGNIYYNVLSKKDNTVSVTYKDPRTNVMYVESCYKGNVVIPRTVTHKGVKYTVAEIGKKAFCFASNLKSVTIPNTVRAIRFLSFGMTGLTTINIPESVVMIEGGAFRQSGKIKTITVSSKNPYFRTEKDVLFNKQTTSLIYCAPGKLRKAYTVPSKVRKIYDAAFAGCTIYKITINSNVNEFVGDPFSSFHFQVSINKTKSSAKRSKHCGVPGWPGVCRQQTH